MVIAAGEKEQEQYSRMQVDRTPAANAGFKLMRYASTSKQVSHDRNFWNKLYDKTNKNPSFAMVWEAIHDRFT